MAYLSRGEQSSDMKVKVYSAWTNQAITYNCDSFDKNQKI